MSLLGLMSTMNRKIWPASVSLMARDMAGRIVPLFIGRISPQVFDQVFRQEQIPFNLIGAHKFFDRKEIRDVVAYKAAC